MIDEGLKWALLRLLNGEKPWPLYLWGEAGRGKTMAALATCDLVAGTAVYRVVEEVADMILERGHWFWDAVENHDLVVLDELGARERATDLHYQAVKRVADAREMYADRVAIYVSNLNPNVVADVYDDRIASRILCGTVFHLQGKDRRTTR